MNPQSKNRRRGQAKASRSAIGAKDAQMYSQTTQPPSSAKSKPIDALNHATPVLDVLKEWGVEIGVPIAPVDAKPELTIEEQAAIGLCKWFLGAELPECPFELRQAVTVLGWAGLRAEARQAIEWAEGRARKPPRLRDGVLVRDLSEVKEQVK